MRTVVCRTMLSGNMTSGTTFETPDLESWPDGGYEVSLDGRLSLVAPFAWGGLPDTTRCGPIPISGVVRLYTSLRAGRERRGFTVEFKDGVVSRVVSGPVADGVEGV